MKPGVILLSLHLLGIISHVDLRLQWIIDKTQSDSVQDMKEAIRKFIRSSGAEEVVLMMRDKRRDDRTKRILEITLESIAQLLPIRYMKLTEDYKLPEDASKVASSRSLILHIYGYEKELNIVELRYVYRQLERQRPIFNYPKNLILLVTNKTKASDVEKFLRYVAPATLGDTVFVEIQQQRSNMSYNMVIHHQNRHTNRSTCKPYSKEDTKFFSEPSIQLKGYRANTIALNDNDEDDSCGLRPIRFILQDALGFEYDSTDHAVLPKGFFFTPYLIDMQFDVKEYNPIIACHPEMLRLGYTCTTPAGDGKLCFFMPVISKILHKVTPWNVFLVLVIGALIVLTFWVFCRGLNLDKRFRHPMNTISIILGLSIPYVVKSLIEKVIYITIVLVSTRYTAMFYAELVDMVLSEKVEFQISSMEDLIASNLTVIGDLDHEFFISGIEEEWPEMKGRFVYEKIPEDKNFMLLADERDGYVMLNELKERIQLKHTQFCLVSSPLMYRVLDGPYFVQITALLTRAVEAGLNRQKACQSAQERIASYYKNLPKTIQNFSEAMPVQYLFYGYVFAAVVFIIEVAIAFVKKRLARKLLFKY